MLSLFSPQHEIKKLTLKYHLAAYFLPPASHFLSLDTCYSHLDTCYLLLATSSSLQASRNSPFAPNRLHPFLLTFQSDHGFFQHLKLIPDLSEVLNQQLQKVRDHRE